MVESVVTVKRYQFSDDETSPCCRNSSSNQTLPEIEARVSDKDVLIRIHCEKQKGFAAKILGEIEKRHLTVINSSFTPFGDCFMDITIVAQVILIALSPIKWYWNIKQSCLRCIIRHVWFYPCRIYCLKHLFYPLIIIFVNLHYHLQMDSGFCMTTKDLVNKLRLAFQQFMWHAEARDHHLAHPISPLPFVVLFVVFI